MQSINHYSGKVKKGEPIMEDVCGNVLMVSKYPTNCKKCRGKISKGSMIWWNRKTRRVVHKDCHVKNVVLTTPGNWNTSLTRPFVGSAKNGTYKGF